MKRADFRVSYNDGKRIKQGNDLLTVLRLATQPQKVMVVVPHDDDAVIASALFIMALIASGVEVHLVVTTDGRQGYCNLKQRKSIVKTREKETIAAYKLLGIPKKRIHFLGFSCSNMLKDQGRRRATGKERKSRKAIAGAIGIQNSFTYFLRKVRPTIVIVPHGDDYHPDHQYTYNELRIAIFHAMGEIWPELGPKHTVTPTLWESAVYCRFQGAPPNLRIEALNRELFELKMKAISAFKSQPQIAPLVDELRKGKPSELIRIRNYEFTKPGDFDEQFVSRPAKRKRVTTK